MRVCATIKTREYKYNLRKVKNNEWIYEEYLRFAKEIAIEAGKIPRVHNWDEVYECIKKLNNWWIYKIYKIKYKRRKINGQYVCNYWNRK